MAFLDDIRKRVRMTSTALDSELQDLIDAAKSDLKYAGVTAEKAADETDTRIKEAITFYCRAYFDLKNDNRQELVDIYERLKNKLTLSADYSAYCVTFTVKDGLTPVQGASITVGSEVKQSNSLGIVKFYSQIKDVDMDYTVSKTGYQSVESSVYLSSDEAVEVGLNV